MKNARCLLPACLVAMLLASTAIAARSDAQQPPANAIEAGASYDRLDHSFADWYNAYLYGEHRFAPHQLVYAQIERTRRFDLTDNQLLAGYYHPLSEQWSLWVEGSGSGSHQVLPRWSGLFDIGRTLPHGFRAEIGYRYSDYRPNPAQLGMLTIERYFGDYRAAYTLYVGKPDGAGAASAHRFACNWYYSDASSVGLAFTTGREVENVGPPTGIVTTEVRDVSLMGRHALDRDWALSYELHWHEQGDLYSRQGVRLGLRRSF
jgi:YaiO family outer membrane protein